MDTSLGGMLFGVLGLALILGVPIGYALGIATAVGLFFTPIPPVYLAQTLFTGTGLFALIAIPGFILAGEIMMRGKLTEKIINVMTVVTGNITGGLGVATVLSCAFFAALSGSSPATTAAIGSIMIPAMVRAGYPVTWAAAVAACGGTLGILIPPSNPMIIYGVTANVSVSGLFMAGVLPGVMLVGILCLYCWGYGKANGIKPSGIKFTWHAFFKAVWVGRSAMAMPIIVLGVIYTGLATPTEASMIAVLYALWIGCINRTLSLRDVFQAMVTTGRITGAVLIVMGPAMAFGKLLTLFDVTSQIAEAFVSVSDNKIVVLLMIAALLVIVGLFMETLSSIVLLSPVLLPAVLHVGGDAVQFGILFIVLSEIGMLTPPLGVNLFVSSAISKVSIEKISMAVLPLIGLLLLFVLLLIFVPSISTWGYALAGGAK